MLGSKKQSLINISAIILAASALVGCGGSSGGGGSVSVGGNGGGGGGGGTTPVVTTPILSIAAQSIKTLRFSWNSVPDTDYYELHEDVDGASGFSLIQGNIADTETSVDLTVPLFQKTNARYIVSSCNASGCTDSDEVQISRADVLNEAIGYIKADLSNNQPVDSYDLFGYTVALSNDGRTLVIGALGDANRTGRVDTFTNDGTSWSFESSINLATQSFLDVGDDFGTAISLSADGNTLAVGARNEDSASLDRSDNTASNAGAVYVFSRAAGNWSLDQYLKAPPGSRSANGLFGHAVDLSNDGTRLAIAAPGENGNQGSVHMFEKNATGWSIQVTLTKDNAQNDDYFGDSVDLSGDGSTLAVGVPYDNYGFAGILPDRSSYDSNLDSGAQSIADSGAVYVYTRTENSTISGPPIISWDIQSFIKASNAGSNDQFGTRVALSEDGSRLAVGAIGEDNSTEGLATDDGLSADSGAVYVFDRSGTTWTQEAYLKAFVIRQTERFGQRLALSGDGSVLLGSSLREAGSVFGLAEDSASVFDDASSGAAYAFKNDNGTWTELAYLKASNTESSDNFGISLAISGDGETIAVGSYLEDSASAATPLDNSVADSGAVYLY